jgi:SAM-dependent methyltransferase
VEPTLLFGRAAQRYDLLRPRYPERAFDELARVLGGLGGARVLEVGAGTGLATAELLGRDAKVTALEPDPSMRCVLAARFPQLEIATTRLEDHEGPDYDAVVGFQSLHWIDQTALWEVTARLLRPGGVLAGVWQLTKIADHRAAAAIAQVLLMHRGNLRRGSHAIVNDGIARLEHTRTAHFGPAVRTEFPWSELRSAASLAGLLATMSDVLELGEEARPCEVALTNALAPFEPLAVEFHCVVVVRHRRT